MGILLRQIEIKNLYYVGDVVVKWVENPYDVTEKTPRVIGIVGTNGSGKSTILSRALPWLIHPESNQFKDLSLKIFNEETVPSFSVEIVFEYNGVIHSAKRSLSYHLESGTFLQSNQLFRHTGDRPDNITSSWDTIFGIDTGTAQPYVCEHKNLAKVARKMANKNGLKDFSDNLGHMELLNALDRLMSAEEIKKVTAETSVLTGPKLKQYKDVHARIKDIEAGLAEKAEELTDEKAKDSAYEIEFGDYELFYDNYQEVQRAKDAESTAQARRRREIREFKSNDTLMKSTFAKLKKHLFDEYGIEPDNLPTAEISNSKRKAVEDFKRECEEIFNRIEQGDLAVLEDIISSDMKLDLSKVVTSDPTAIGEQTNNLKVQIKKLNDAQIALKRVTRAVTANDSVSTATLDAWTLARTKILELEPIVSQLQSSVNDFKEMKEKIVSHEAAQPQIEECENRIKAISSFKQLIDKSIVRFQNQSQKEMLNDSQILLNGIYTAENWEITQDRGTILPIKDGTQLDLSKPDEFGGPSSGQARTIALCIMIQRYLKTKCNIPLILDDAYKDISEENKDESTMLRTLAEVHTLGLTLNSGTNQVIWVNVRPPVTSDAVLGTITTKSLAENNEHLMAPPWNGKPVIGTNVKKEGA